VKKGLLLINVGTPEKLELESVKTYLTEFLTDPMVIPGPSFFRNFLVKGIIVPFRSQKSLNKYKKIWTPDGSPLRFFGEALRKKVLEKLRLQWGDQFEVYSCMRYGVPSIASVLEKLAEQGISEVLVVPLYPQWSESTTETVIAKLKQLNEIWKFQIRYKQTFYDDIHFLSAHKHLLDSALKEFSAEHVLFSFHGLPDKPIAQRYYKECHLTAQLLGSILGQKKWSVSFQSRLGPTKWLAPSTEESIIDLAQQGIKKLLVVSPAFVADGLETLEELAIEGASLFQEKSGGGQLYLVPSLNDSDLWAQAIVEWIKEGKFV
jgi:ferrochelatase